MKKFDYQPMNAIEYFLHEIARNTEEISELLKKQSSTFDEELLKGVEKEIEQIKEAVKEEVVVEEVKPAPRKRAPRKKG